MPTPARDRQGAPGRPWSGKPDTSLRCRRRLAGIDRADHLLDRRLLDKDILSIERDKQKLSINLANQPEALAFVDSIRGTLSGNRAALEKNYALHLAGNADKWVLTLLPSDQKIASLVQRITVSGNKNQVRVIEYLQADGDRSVLNIDPVDVK